MAYGLHPEVYDDLDEIYQYVRRFHPRSAEELLDGFLSAFELLADFPHHGHRRPDLTSQPMRFKVIRNYLIAYLPHHELIWVVAVVDGRINPRVIAAILRGRE
jgi:plasmid stabilization system protein ParE